VQNPLTGEVFKWRGAIGEQALEVATNLAMKDLNVLMSFNGYGLDHRL
jgi:hypothetical protein